jgi:hypothetical protein
MPALYAKVHDFMKAKMKEVTDLAITADCWTSRGNDAFIATSGHYIDADWRMVEVQLETSSFPEKHDGPNIKTKVDEALAALCPQAAVSMLICDSGANMIAAAKLGDYNRGSCFGHDLQLDVGRALEKDPSLKRLLERCRALVGHFHHSPAATTALEKLATAAGKTQTHLVRDVSTRWNSTFDMLQRLSLLGTFANEVLREKKRHDLCLETSELSLIDKLVVILGCPASATPLLSASAYPTISLVYPVTFRIVEQLRENERMHRSLLGPAIISEVQATFHATLNPVLALATMLDPRFKDLKGWLPTDHPWGPELRLRLATALEEIPRTSAPKKQREEKDYFSSLFGDDGPDDENELERYLAVEKPAGLDILRWWKANESRFPRLAKLARKWLAVPATSVPVERFFSQGGNIVTNKRTALSARHVAMLMFIGANVKHME